MSEARTEVLRHVAVMIDDPNNSAYSGVVREAADTIDQLRQRIQELEAERSWIPVSEALPEPSGEKYGDYQDSKPVALLLNNGEWCKGHFVHSSIGGAWCSHYSPSVNEMVTHWKPLPPAPEQQEGEG